MRLGLLLVGVLAAGCASEPAPDLLTASPAPELTPRGAPDRCDRARVELNEHRAMQTGLRAAYSISVLSGYEGHVAKLGPRMIAGEQETSRLLAAMYEECFADE